MKRSPIDRRAFRSFLVPTALVFASVLVALTVGEIAARLAGFSPFERKGVRLPLTWAARDPVLGWASKPGVWRVDAQKRPMTILPDGSRKTACQPAVEDAATALVVGGSITQGFGVEDDETYVSLLQRRFPSVRFVNYGTAAYGTYQSYLRMRRYFREHADNPPQLVLYGMLGSHADRNAATFEWLRVLKTWSGHHVTPPHVLLDDKRRLTAHPLQERRIWPLADRLALVNVIHNAALYFRTAGNNKVMFKVTRRVLLRMNNLCKESGACFVVCFLTLQRRLIVVYEPTLLRHDIPYVYCDRDLSEDEEPLWRLGPKGHPNEISHEYWARCIGNYLEERGLIPVRGPEGE